MSSIANSRILFNSIPTGYPELGKTIVHNTSEQINVETVPLNGGILLKIIVLSPDPFQRNLMIPPSDEMFMPVYAIGEPIVGLAVAVVLRSENDAVNPGDHLHGFLPWKSYVVLPSAEGLSILDNKYGLPWTSYVGVLGLAGHTAWMAWKEYAKPRAGQTAFVTAAAGPVGSFVIQLAKRAGMKVIASAGSEDKVAWAKVVGADVALNYKTESTQGVLKKEGPIDLYWDNVAGESLDAALEAASVGATFIECGMASGYNTGHAPIKNLIKIIEKAITMNGLTVTLLYEKYLDEFYATVPKLVADGDIKHREEIYRGMDSVDEALLKTVRGAVKGKAVVIIAEQ
ncbi:hypothetical protein D9611_010729 [Ephemerocybe angulata]|uniref:Enoyl reductase (ER) domain-containing protein n=1 Tax=Ephemerocybe angulata TaxID=980116 RepID=A0A8H5BE43_9AGAR|nr:hypothetical protein D9611_010729 [Tulosesus angulatus]